MDSHGLIVDELMLGDGISLDSSETVLSISGGKDSTAMYLLALEWGRPFRAVFADTGNEHEWTVDYVNALHEKTGGPKVETFYRQYTAEDFDRKRKFIAEKWPGKGISDSLCERAIAATKPSGNPFLDACILRSGFPGTRGRFCTEHLKIIPIREQVYAPAWERDLTVVSWQGVRHEESAARADALLWQRIQTRQKDGELYVHRPLIEWTLDDVWKQHRRHGVEPNPLYANGMTRVGCMPCIYERKGELRIIAERFPEHIDRIREWEDIVLQVSRSAPEDVSFFMRNKMAGANNGERATIDKVVNWASSARGTSDMYDLIPITDVRADLLLSCGEWGACE